MEKYWGDDPFVTRRLKVEREYYTDSPVRSKKYVEDECKSLVDQIIEFTV